MEGDNNNVHPIMRSILHGCDLAKRMESELPLLWKENPNYNNNYIIDQISQKCDEIISMFTLAKQQICSISPIQLDHLLLPHHTYYQEMVTGKGKEAAVSVAPYASTKDGSHENHLGRIEVGGSSSSAKLPKNPRWSSRYNVEDLANKRVRVSAPQCGNLEMPPDDNFTWRKYGQKQILNAKYPRSYYRCTHQKLYKCQAKKQVQRLDNDPTTLEILYRGEHTCHMSSTAPSIPPPPSQLFVNQQHHILPFHGPHSMITNITHNSSHPWLHTLDHQHQQDYHHHHHQLYGLSNSSSSTSSSSSNILCNSTNTQPGLSTVGSIHQGGLGSVNQIHVPTKDSWIDVFNSGRSGSNALELIFTPTHDTNDS